MTGFCDCFEVRVQIGDGLEDLTGRHLDVAGSPVLQAALDAAGAVVTMDMSGLAYDGPNAHVDWGPCLSR